MVVVSGVHICIQPLSEHNFVNYRCIDFTLGMHFPVVRRFAVPKKPVSRSKVKVTLRGQTKITFICIEGFSYDLQKIFYKATGVQWVKFRSLRQRSRSDIQVKGLTKISECVNFHLFISLWYIPWKMFTVIRVSVIPLTQFCICKVNAVIFLPKIWGRI